MSFSTCGTAGEVTISLPQNSELVHFFECTNDTKATYPMNLIKNAIKAIHMSEKLSLRMDCQNILCMQYMLCFPEGNCFLEFYCAPEVDYEDWFLFFINKLIKILVKKSKVNGIKVTNFHFATVHFLNYFNIMFLLDLSFR